MLFGEDWATGGDSANEGNVDGLFGLDGIVIVGIGDFKGAAFGGVLADIALFDQGFDLITHGCGGGEAGSLADLSHGWGIAVGQDGFFDDFKDQLLAGGEAIVTCGAIWKLRDGCWGSFIYIA